MLVSFDTKYNMKTQDQLLNTIIESLKEKEQESVSSWNIAKWYLNNVMQRKLLWKASNNEMTMASIRAWSKQYSWYDDYKINNKPVDYNYWDIQSKLTLQKPYSWTEMYKFSQNKLNSINTPKI